MSRVKISCMHLSKTIGNCNHEIIASEASVTFLLNSVPANVKAVIFGLKNKHSRFLINALCRRCDLRTNFLAVVLSPVFVIFSFISINWYQQLLPNCEAMPCPALDIYKNNKRASFDLKIL